MKKLLITLALAFLAGCSDHRNSATRPDEGDTLSLPDLPDTTGTDTAIVAKGPAIQLSLVGGLKKGALLKAGVNTDVACPDSVDICLGDLYKSRSYYFILNNAGDSAITNLTITSTLSSWSVTPSNIPVLNLPGQTSLTTLLTLGIGHGTPLYKVSDEPFQWDGVEGDGSVVDTLTFKWDGGEEKYTIAIVARVVRFAWADEYHNKVEILGNCGVSSAAHGEWAPGDTVTAWKVGDDGAPLIPGQSDGADTYYTNDVYDGNFKSDCMAITNADYWVQNIEGEIVTKFLSAPWIVETSWEI